MTDELLNLDLDYHPNLEGKTDYKIGVIGSGSPRVETIARGTLSPHPAPGLAPPGR